MPYTLGSRSRHISVLKKAGMRTDSRRNNRRQTINRRLTTAWWVFARGIRSVCGMNNDAAATVALPLPALAANDANAQSGGGSAYGAPTADSQFSAANDSKLPPGYDNTTQRLIRVTGPLPAEQQTQVALDENAIADHLERFLQAEDNKAACRVFHNMFGGIHLYCFPPSEQLQRNYWTVCTMGVSGTRMKVPDDIEDGDQYARCELMCYLPADWHFPAALGVGDGSTADDWQVVGCRVHMTPGCLTFVAYVASRSDSLSGRLQS
jgi:hypothetical protein